MDKPTRPDWLPKEAAYKTAAIQPRKEIAGCPFSQDWPGGWHEKIEFAKHPIAGTVLAAPNREIEAKLIVAGFTQAWNYGWLNLEWIRNTYEPELLTP